MTNSVLGDAFAHHLWATERLIEACAVLTPAQLKTPVPGTYGSIIDTLRHLVGADGWYLTFFSKSGARLDENRDGSFVEMRSVMATNGPLWTELISGALDPDEDVVERGDEGWEFHAPMGIRLAQVIHHGTDHRSQVCTALTSLGLTPPLIDVWDFGEATSRTRSVPPPTPA